MMQLISNKNFLTALMVCIGKNCLILSDWVSNFIVVVVGATLTTRIGCRKILGGSQVTHHQMFISRVYSSLILFNNIPYHSQLSFVIFTKMLFK